MPRIKAKKKDYKATDFCRWLKGEMAMKDIRQKTVAEWLGTTQQTVSFKIKNGCFSLKELLILFEKLETPAEQIGKLLAMV